MFGFSKVVAKCNEQYVGDSLYGQLDNSQFCKCGNQLKRTLIYADKSDTLISVLVCKKCHTIVKN